MKEFNRHFFLLFLIFLTFVVLQGNAWAASQAKYPIPPDSDKRLFFLQRSTNSNTIVYDANMTSDGKLKLNQPVDIYWLRYNTDGKRRALNFAERNLAYGLSHQSRDNGKSFIIKLMAYNERPIRISIDKAGKPIAQTQINGKQAKLKRIFIDVDGSGFFSSVNYIELIGEDLINGAPVVEKFNPNEESDFF